MLTAASLRSYKHKDLAQMAKRRGVSGWHSMRKDQLVQALVKVARSEAAKSRSSNGNGAKKKSGKGAKAKAPVTKKKTSTKATAVARRIAAAQKERENHKDLARTNGSVNGNGKSHRSGPGTSVDARDRVVMMVRDPYWLHVHWQLTRTGIDRARAALAQGWHGAKPILRLYEVDAGTTTSATARVSRDIEIHGGVQNWYIDVSTPPQSYVVEIGYLTTGGRFHCICRSNVVTTPRPGSAGASDANWADVAANCDKIYALSGGYSSDTHSGELQELFEERMKRPMGTPMTTRYGAGAKRFLSRESEFDLQVDAEMIIRGQTDPTAHLMMGGEPVNLNPDGSFAVRMDLGNQRQVIPVVAESADGVEQRTIVIAVERNTKVMEPVTRDPNEV